MVSTKLPIEFQKVDEDSRRPTPSGHAALCFGLGEAAMESSFALLIACGHRALGDAKRTAAWGAGLVGERRADGGVVLFGAERDRVVAVACSAASSPVVDDGERVRQVDAVRLRRVRDG
jgi:hypothetical protein